MPLANIGDSKVYKLFDNLEKRSGYVVDHMLHTCKKFYCV